MDEPGMVLLERAEELDAVRSLCAQAAGGSGCVAIVEGPPGIGKTSLLSAAHHVATDVGLSVHAARAGRLEGDLPWNLVRQLFAGVIAAEPGRRAELLDGAASLAAPALGLDTTGPPADEAGALHGLYWLTNALAAQRPLLLAVDDAQWGDSPSLRYLSYLGARVSDLPVLLLLTIRAGEARGGQLQQLATSPGLERVGLPALSHRATAELTRTALGKRAAEEFCAACHHASGGNPFLLKQLLGQLNRDGVDPTAARAREVEHVTPDGVRRAVVLRLSELDAGARALARAMVILGDRSELWITARMAGLDLEPAARAADTLAGADILAPGTPLRFVHPLVREAIYAELPTHQRAAEHARAARLLAELGADLNRVATQLLLAEPAGDSWVVDRLREAAAIARAGGAREPAVDFMRRAWAEPPDDAVRVTVLRELAQAEALGGSEAAIEHLQGALNLTRQPRERAQIGLELVYLLFRHGQVQNAVELAQSLLEEVPAEERGLRLGLIAAAVTGGVLVPDLQARVAGLVDRIPEDLPGETPEERLALSARLAARLVGRGDMDEVADLAARSLGGTMLLRDLASSELLYWNATSALIVADRFDAARSAIERAFADARRRGSTVGFALSSCFRSLFHYRAGDVTAAAADGRQALAVTDPSEFQIHAYAAAFLLDCLIERGELDEAIALATAPQFDGDLPPLLAFDLLRVARARARIEAGDAKRGVEELLAVGESGGAAEFGTAISPWRARASVGLSRLGRREAASSLAEQELSLARATKSAWGETIALEALADADPERAPVLLERAITIADQHELALERARATLMLGAAQRRRGQRRLASELLHEALDAADSCGAVALEERARAELVAIGLGPRRRATSAGALTPSERRVAELAAQGMTNREIAQSLFVSLRTVETHLTHTYQKLCIESRGELEPALTAG